MPLPTPSLTVAPSSLLLAVVAAVGMATIGVISRITGLNAESITFYRLGLGALFLLGYLLLTKRHAGLTTLPGRQVVISGSLLAAFILFYVQAMNYTQMANAILMVYLAPIVAAIAAHALFNERLAAAQVLLIGLALFGGSDVLPRRLPKGTCTVPSHLSENSFGAIMHSMLVWLFGFKQQWFSLHGTAAQFPACDLELDAFSPVPLKSM